MTLADLGRADAVLCTNSLRLVSQVVALDRKPLAGSLRTAALATQMAKIVQADCGIDPRRFIDH